MLSFHEVAAILQSWCGKRVRCVARTHPDDPDASGVMFEDEWPLGVRFVIPIEPPNKDGTGRWFAFDQAGLTLAEWLEDGRMLRLTFDSTWSMHPHEDLVLTLEGPGWMP